MPFDPCWWIDTRDKPGLLWAFLKHFEGRAIVSFESEDLKARLQDIPGADSRETAVLRRVTRMPTLEFTTLPVTAETTASLKHRLRETGLFQDGGALIHVQVQCGDALVLGAYDNFHRNCVCAWPPTPETLLQELVRTGVIRAYGLEESRERPDRDL